jgi:hypothetical protein
VLPRSRCGSVRIYLRIVCTVQIDSPRSRGAERQLGVDIQNFILESMAFSSGVSRN